MNGATCLWLNSPGWWGWGDGAGNAFSARFQLLISINLRLNAARNSLGIVAEHVESFMATVSSQTALMNMTMSSGLFGGLPDHRIGIL